MGSPGSSEVKNPPTNAGDARDWGLIPGSGRSPGEGNGNPLQYSCLTNPMDRGAWQATVLRIAKSLILLSIHMHVCICTHTTPGGEEKQGMIFSQGFRGCMPAKTLKVDFWLQNYETINFCYPIPPRLWYLCSSLRKPVQWLSWPGVLKH